MGASERRKRRRDAGLDDPAPALAASSRGSGAPEPCSCASFRLAAASTPGLAMSHDDERDSDDDLDASIDGADDRPRISPEEMRAWIAREDVIDRMKSAIGAVMPKKTPD